MLLWRNSPEIPLVIVKPLNRVLKQPNNGFSHAHVFTQREPFLYMHRDSARYFSTKFGLIGHTINWPQPY